MPTDLVELTKTSQEQFFGALGALQDTMLETYTKFATATEKFRDGWLVTGDIAKIDSEQYLIIADRSKDLIKSGGEWISSVDMEAAIMAMDGVAEAAVVAVPDAKWQERPLACVVPKPNFVNDITEEELREFLQPKFPKFWLPDAVVFMNEMPKTSVGKFDKKVLRARFRNPAAPA